MKKVTSIEKFNYIPHDFCPPSNPPHPMQKDFLGTKYALLNQQMIQFLTPFTNMKSHKWDLKRIKCIQILLLPHKN